MEKDGAARGAVLITGAAGGMGNAAAKVAEAVFTVMKKRRPPAVKNLNRNPLMLLLNALPVKMNRAIVRKILTRK